MSYGYSRNLNLSFDEVDKKLRAALMEQGFGVITEVDIQEKLKEKLGVDFTRYRILGACNPPIAFELLSIEREIGLLLPCNVVFWENNDNSVTVSGIDAVKMLSVTGREDFTVQAEKVNGLLENAINSI